MTAVNDLAAWIMHFRTISTSKTAEELLNGAQAAALETVAYTFLGLGRAAVTAMRLQIELVLGYTYFKDHFVEWDRVRMTGDGFMLFTAVQNYHHESNKTFAARLDMMQKGALPTLREVYRTLSAHVHGQSPYTLPKVGPLQSTVLGMDLMKSVVEMQTHSMDALSCFLVATYAAEWPQLPPRFVSRVSKSLTPKQRRLFFSDDA